MTAAPRTSRRRALLISLAVVVAYCVALAAGLVMWRGVSDFFSGPTEDDIRVDQQALETWERTVPPALEDLNAVPAVPGLEPDGPAYLNRCGLDSGELFDVSAGRSWNATDYDESADSGFPVKPSLRTGRGFVQIVEHLSQEWTVVERSNTTGSVTAANPRFDRVVLKRHVRGTRLSIVVDVSEFGVDSFVWFKGAPRVCRWTKEYRQRG